MKFLFDYPSVCIYLAASASAAPFSSGLLDSAFGKRQSPGLSPSNVTVDLGYEVYQGYYDSSSGLNSWKG